MDNSTHSFGKQQGKVTLYDLCDEDKEKIGHLIVLAANQKEEKEKLQKMLQDYTQQYERELSKLKQLNQSKSHEAKELDQRLKASVDMLSRVEVCASHPFVSITCVSLR